MNNKTKFALKRAEHAVWETAAATLPATVTITPAMLKEFDCSVLWVVAAWAASALLAGAMSFVKSMAAGMPEDALEKTLYDLDNVPKEED